MIYLIGFLIGLTIFNIISNYINSKRIKFLSKLLDKDVNNLTRLIKVVKAIQKVVDNETEDKDFF